MRVITDVNAAVHAVMTGQPIKYTYFGLWTEEFKAEQLAF